MTIHYHGTPITPRSELLKMTGRHFCVPFSDPRDTDVALRIGQSVLFDNGAFSAYTRGAAIDEHALHEWLDARLYPPHWAIALDAIGGDEDTQRAMLKRWPHGADLSAPVWHLHLSLDYLRELLDNWPRVAFGSSGEYWQIGSERWHRRIDQAWDVIEARGWRTWIHMLRGGSQCGRYPFASVDSTNAARNHKSTPVPIAEYIDRIDAKQCPPRRHGRQHQIQFK